MTFDTDTIETGAQSVTATVCENAALYGAAPERDEFDNLLPKGVIAFPGSGITENLVDKARQLGIPVQRIAA